MDLNELQSLNIRELSKLAHKLNVDGGIAGLNRQTLIIKILEANAKNDGSFSAKGVLEVMQDGYGFLRSPDYNYMPGPDDIYVSPSQIKRFGMKTGHLVAGQIRPPKSKERFYALLKVELVNDQPVEKLKNCILFENFTPLYPEKRFVLEADEKNISPIIAIPTTAGTGSETGRASAIINSRTGIKKIIFHPKFLPSIVILDPVLTKDLSPRLTGATGMDALAHNLEAFCAPGFHPMADGIAIEGMRLIKKSLLKAVKNGSDLDARSDLLAAASMGSTAFQKGLGAIHSLSHPLNAQFNLHHGLSNAIFMPCLLYTSPSPRD